VEHTPLPHHPAIGRSTAVLQENMVVQKSKGMNEFLRVTLASPPPSARRPRDARIMTDQVSDERVPGAIMTEGPSTPTGSRASEHSSSKLSPRPHSPLSAGRPLAVEAPNTPGRMNGLKSTILEAKTAEGEGKLELAQRAYQRALIMLPGEERLLRKLERLEARMLAMGIGECTLTGDESSTTPLREGSMCRDVDIDDVEDHELLNESMHFMTPPPLSRSCSKKRGHIHQRSAMGHSPNTVALSLFEDDEDSGNISLGDSEDSIAHVTDQHGEGYQVTKSARMRQLERVGKELSHVMEKQLLEVINMGSQEQLMTLHGIGARRSQAIMSARQEAPFTQLRDLSRIGLYSPQIIRICKQNTLERLDFA
jgi:DNA uptake protein ComE-like DNA-binding protein